MSKPGESMINITVRTNKVGSECEVCSGYTESEWLKLSDDEQCEVMSEKAWEVIDVYPTLGEPKK